MQWFIETGAGLKENILHFNGHKVHLDTNEKWSVEDCMMISEVQEDDIEEEMCWELSKSQEKKEEVKPEIKLTSDEMKQFKK